MPGVPVYHSIAEELRQRIHDGRLRPGEQLPSVREQARLLSVNRMTVAHAYRTLAHEGLVQGRVGSGTVVTGDTPAERPLAPPTPLLWDALASEALDAVAETLRGAEALETEPPDGRITFERSTPDPGLLRLAPLRRALSDSLEAEGPELLGPGPVEGHPELRRAVAGLLAQRGLGCREEEVLIVSGVQQGLDLILRTFLKPGETVITDDPAYYRSLVLFRYHRAHVLGLPVHEQADRAGMLTALLSERPTRLIYTVSTFHNPTGHSQSREERLLFLEAARHRPLALIEDDSLWELRYEGEPVPPLGALDASGSVLTLGSFSKILAPGLRLGWVVGPPEALRALARVKEISDLRGNLLIQAAVARMVNEGALQAHLKRVLRIYRKRRDAMAAALERHFPHQAVWQRPQGGLNFWVSLPPPCDTRRLLDSALARGVSFCPGTLFRVRSGGENQLRLAFGHLRPAAIERGLAILGALVHEEIARARSARSRSGRRAEPLF
ncbi:MAG: PLP-dependent aminotransferase family protein [Acidobacteriota bacterium]